MFVGLRDDVKNIIFYKVNIIRWKVLKIYFDFQMKFRIFCVFYIRRVIKISLSE
jgi:hypothetical protein